jgi:hypothetical protein
MRRSELAIWAFLGYSGVSVVTLEDEREVTVMANRERVDIKLQSYYGPGATASVLLAKMGKPIRVYNITSAYPFTPSR